MFIVSHGAERRDVSLHAAVTGPGLVQLLANLWAQVWPTTHLMFGPYQVDWVQKRLKITHPHISTDTETQKRTFHEIIQFSLKHLYLMDIVLQVMRFASASSCHVTAMRTTCAVRSSFY